MSGMTKLDHANTPGAPPSLFLGPTGAIPRDSHAHPPQPTTLEQKAGGSEWPKVQRRAPNRTRGMCGPAGAGIDETFEHCGFRTQIIDGNL